MKKFFSLTLVALMLMLLPSAVFAGEDFTITAKWDDSKKTVVANWTEYEGSFKEYTVLVLNEKADLEGDYVQMNLPKSVAAGTTTYTFPSAWFAGNGSYERGGKNYKVSVRVLAKDGETIKNGYSNIVVSPIPFLDKPTVTFSKNGIVTFSKVDNATNYSLILYNSNDKEICPVSTQNTCDFSDYMEVGNQYYVTVQPQPNSNNYRTPAPVKSSTITFTDEAEDTIIKSVKMKIAIPNDGMTLPTDTSLVTFEKGEAVVKSIQWTINNKTYAGECKNGEKYNVIITVTPKSGTKFVDGLVGVINGDNDTVRVKVSDTEYKYSSEVTIGYNNTIKITSEPSNGEYLDGEETTFAVKATGSNIKYEWQILSISTNKRGGISTVITKLGTTASNKLKLDSTYNGKQIRCRLYNDKGNIYTTPITLTMVTEKTKETLKNVELGLASKLEIGKKLPNLGTGTYDYAVSSTTWSPSDSVAKAGTKYTVTAVVDIDDFDGIFDSNVTATVGGKTATVVSGKGTDTLKVTYTFDALEEKVVGTIKNVELGIASKLEIGKKLPNLGTGTYDYAVSSTTWSPSDSVVKAGTKYTVTAIVDIDDFDGIFDSNVTATIDGKTATVVSGKGTNTLKVSYTFDALVEEEEKWVNEFKITIAEPKVDGTLSQKAIASSNGFEITKVVWTPNDKKAVKDTIYTVTIYVEPSEGYQLRSDYFGKVNGNNATMPSDYTKGKFYVEYTFKPDQKTWTNVSDWAETEVKEANENSLIPNMLDKQDLTQNITREEFASVAVKLYEKLSGKTAEASATNPFTDTTNEEILKAYNLGITNGISETLFSPSALITREQMATMMIRAISKAGIETTYSIEKKFDDTTEISTWAENGVYYMNYHGIIKGIGYRANIGDNCFNPQANASREQALLISTRSVKALKNK